jgi:flavin-dependent dehydrogenase
VTEIKKTLIIGGGLAGLTAAYLLAKGGVDVELLEKKSYPFHRVCGEYVSNEVKDFLIREGLFPMEMELPQMDKFQFSDALGKDVTVPLGLGGFGISRYKLDEFLYQKVLAMGGKVSTGVQVVEIDYDEKERQFRLKLADGKELFATHVIGAYGKRSTLDKFLKRPFIAHRSPYIGVKYHIKGEVDRSTVALHNFKGGYCGLNAIEEGKANLCYLGNRDQLRQFGSIEEMEKQVVWKNPLLKKLFSESEFLFEKPEVINEVNFEKKETIVNHMLMAGDTAGLITPLCGNGMAIAIQSGKLAAEAILKGTTQQEIEYDYRTQWQSVFAKRLRLGRNVQKLFGREIASVFTRNLIQHVPFISNQIIKNTHGKPF